MTPPGRVPTPAEVWPDVHVRGERVLLLLDGLLARIEQGLALPERLHPLLNTGALANTAFFVAVVSGVAVLPLYTPSVHDAWSSVEALSSAASTAWIRSVHRYSSDATMLFAVLHMLRLFAARRFTGPRWLAWITGGLLVGALWLIGWLGYWLVWDERGSRVAVGTARMFDGFPIFADPMSRSFLTDATVSSLFFFVVFFAHMLLPLGMGVLLWLHIGRVSRSRFFASRALTVALLLTLIVVSVLWPAASGTPAAMASIPRGYAIDAWYLAPLAATDRLSPAVLWLVLLMSGAFGLSMPWTLRRGTTRTATVDSSRCTACSRCVQDCPYGAIRLVPRTDDNKRFPSWAEIDPAKCVGCGICAGSCDPSAIGLPWFVTLDQRKRVDAGFQQGSDVRFVAFVCSSAVARTLEVDERGHCVDLPGCRVHAVPCAGWLHAVTVERAIKHGAQGVLIVTCGPGECRFREGADWTEARMAGTREPGLRVDRVPSNRIRIVAPRHATALRLAANGFRAGIDDSAARQTRGRTALAAVAVTVGLTAALVVGSDLGYVAPAAGPQLVVTFAHPGESREACRDATAEELAAQPIHMRSPQICSRERSPVRLRISVDGGSPVESSYAPNGVWGDGNSVAIERIALTPGPHHIELALADEAADWKWTDARDLVFAEQHMQVVRFDRTTGFIWPASTVR